MKRRRIAMILAGVAAFLIGFLLTLKSAPAEVRFDYKVRNDFFAGFSGDKAALDRGMKACEETLVTEPKHAEALVWHGAGLYYNGGQAYQAGNMERGQELVMKGIMEMDTAVELEPANVGVRVPRGAVLLQSTLFMPDNPMRTPLIEKGLRDYEKVLELQKAHFDQMDTHPRGELLFGIADAQQRLGNTAAAKQTFERIAKELNGSSYDKRAKIWLETGKLTPGQARCAGCHTPGK